MKTETKKSTEKAKFNLVVFYGPFAVGKYTVAKEFQKYSGYKFFHNHHAYDLAASIFERGMINFSRLYENINFSVLREIAKAKVNVVTTHAYSAKYVSKTGLSDPAYMKKIESIVKKAGGTAYFVHLTANTKILLKRVQGNSRKKFLKLKDPKVLKKVLNDKTKDFITSAPVKNNIEINNSRLSPKQVVMQVMKFINTR